jgi:uncharacterized protein YjeT (DUF2065 family)
MMETGMDVSLFLAKLLGLYFLILAFICIFRKRQVRATGKELVSSPSALAVSAEISLLFGLVIAIDHTIWEADWRGVVTALGYLLILRGILRFGFPAHVKKCKTKLLDKGYPLVCLILLALGAYLTYWGFIAS